jgi:hypothetical protein
MVVEFGRTLDRMERYQNTTWKTKAWLNQAFESY